MDEEDESDSLMNQHDSSVFYLLNAAVLPSSSSSASLVPENSGDTDCPLCPDVSVTSADTIRKHLVNVHDAQSFTFGASRHVLCRLDCNNVTSPHYHCLCGVILQTRGGAERHIKRCLQDMNADTERREIEGLEPPLKLTRKIKKSVKKALKKTGNISLTNITRKNPDGELEECNLLPTKNLVTEISGSVINILESHTDAEEAQITDPPMDCIVEAASAPGGVEHVDRHVSILPRGTSAVFLLPDLSVKRPCPLCPEYKPSKGFNMRRHLKTHDKHSFTVGDYKFMLCRLNTCGNKAKKASHYHCLCGKIFRLPTRAKIHIYGCIQKRDSTGGLALESTEATTPLPLEVIIMKHRELNMATQLEVNIDTDPQTSTSCNVIPNELDISRTDSIESDETPSFHDEDEPMEDEHCFEVITAQEANAEDETSNKSEEDQPVCPGNAPGRQMHLVTDPKVLKNAILPKLLSAKALVTEDQKSCPLCPPDFLKKGSMYVMKQHMEFHDKHSHIVGAHKFLLCRLQCCSKRSHYHCVCGRVFRLLSEAKLHSGNCAMCLDEMSAFGKDRLSVVDTEQSQVSTIINVKSSKAGAPTKKCKKKKEKKTEAVFEEHVPVSGNPAIILRDQSSVILTGSARHTSCRLCPKTVIRSKEVYHIRRHMIRFHDKHSITYGSYKHLICRLPCGTRRSHYHCLCGKIIRVLNQARSHIRDCAMLRGDILLEDLPPIGEATSDVQPDINMEHGYFDLSCEAPVDCSQIPAILPVDQSVDTLVDTASTIKVRCPLCPLSRFKSAMPGRVLKHMRRIHDRRSCSYGGYKYLACYHKCGLRRMSHYHCVCGKLVKGLSSFRRHIRVCADKQINQEDQFDPDAPCSISVIGAKLSVMLAGDSAVSLLPPSLDKPACPLCPVSRVKPRHASYIRRHLRVLHDKISITHNGYKFLVCRLRCRKTKRSHFHCLCGKILFGRKWGRYHINRCHVLTATQVVQVLQDRTLQESVMAVAAIEELQDIPEIEEPEYYDEMSMTEYVQTEQQQADQQQHGLDPSDVQLYEIQIPVDPQLQELQDQVEQQIYVEMDHEPEPEDESQTLQELESQPVQREKQTFLLNTPPLMMSPADSLKMLKVHVSIMPALSQCTSLVKGKVRKVRFRCPLCPSDLVRPAKGSMIRTHLRGYHERYTFTHGVYKYINCRQPCAGNKTPHYHCLCGKVIHDQDIARRHVAQCVGNAEIMYVIVDMKSDADTYLQRMIVSYTVPDKVSEEHAIRGISDNNTIVTAMDHENIHYRFTPQNLAPEEVSANTVSNAILPKDLSSVELVPGPTKDIIQCPLCPEEVHPANEAWQIRLHLKQFHDKHSFQYGEHRHFLCRRHCWDKKDSHYHCLCGKALRSVIVARNHLSVCKVALDTHIKYTEGDENTKGHHFVQISKQTEGESAQQEEQQNIETSNAIQAIEALNSTNEERKVSSVVVVNGQTTQQNPNKTSGDAVDGKTSKPKVVAKGKHDDITLRKDRPASSCWAMLQSDQSALAFMPENTSVGRTNACRLCPPSKIKKMTLYDLKRHLLQFHEKHSFIIGDYKFVACRLDCFAKNHSHYHCICGQVVRQLAKAKTHIEQCIKIYKTLDGVPHNVIDMSIPADRPLTDTDGVSQVEIVNESDVVTLAPLPAVSVINSSTVFTQGAVEEEFTVMDNEVLLPTDEYGVLIKEEDQPHAVLNFSISGSPTKDLNMSHEDTAEGEDPFNNQTFNSNDLRERKSEHPPECSLVIANDTVEGSKVVPYVANMSVIPKSAPLVSILDDVITEAAFPCPLCDHSIVKPNKRRMITRHVNNFHLRHSFIIGNHRYMLCRLQCEKMTRSHYHCLCGKTFRILYLAKRHIEECPTSSLTYDEEKGEILQKSAEANDAADEPCDDHNNSSDDTMMLNLAILPSASSSVSLIPSAPGVVPCPLCPIDMVPPRPSDQLAAHMKYIHDRHSFVITDQKYVLCRNPCQMFQFSHYHCHCGRIIRGIKRAQRHIQNCSRPVVHDNIDSEDTNLNSTEVKDNDNVYTHPSILARNQSASSLVLERGKHFCPLCPQENAQPQRAGIIRKHLKRYHDKHSYTTGSNDTQGHTYVLCRQSCEGIETSHYHCLCGKMYRRLPQAKHHWEKCPFDRLDISQLKVKQQSKIKLKIEKKESSVKFIFLEDTDCDQVSASNVGERSANTEAESCEEVVLKTEVQDEVESVQVHTDDNDGDPGKADNEDWYQVVVNEDATQDNVDSNEEEEDRPIPVEDVTYTVVPETDQGSTQVVYAMEDESSERPADHTTYTVVQNHEVCEENEERVVYNVEDLPDGEHTEQSGQVYDAGAVESTSDIEVSENQAKKGKIYFLVV